MAECKLFSFIVGSFTKLMEQTALVVSVLLIPETHGSVLLILRLLFLWKKRKRQRKKTIFLSQIWHRRVWQWVQVPKVEYIMFESCVSALRHNVHSRIFCLSLFPCVLPVCFFCFFPPAEVEARKMNWTGLSEVFLVGCPSPLDAATAGGTLSEKKWKEIGGWLYCANQVMKRKSRSLEGRIPWGGMI